MILLIAFAFLGGVVTILSPCILPILPIVLSGTVGGGKRRPLGIITGFVLSFTFFTLFLSALVAATGLSADNLRSLSVVILIIFGLSLLLPGFQRAVEKLFSRLSGGVSTGNKDGFSGGIIIGLSLGLLWTPCVGPILAAIITLAATSAVTLNAFFITLAYSLGTAIPMFVIMVGGRNLLGKAPWLTKNSTNIQKAFGVLMIATAIGIFFNVDRKFQAYILNKFPNYGVGLTKLEDNEAVKNELDKLSDKKNDLFSDLPDAFYQTAPELIQGGEWFNSDPLKLSELRGKVVLVDFWTYTCINCIRTLPYLKSWHEKYKDKGLIIIGVHTPEFEFEKNPENVQKAISDFGLEYPVMQDNDYATWRAYNNRYWPAKYFIDKNGKIRSTHFGEGEYDESERTIQKLLEETGIDVDDMAINNPTYNVEALTPETYLGYLRIDNFVSNEQIRRDEEFKYTGPKNLSNNNFAFEGSWNIGDERAMPATGSKLIFNYSAKNIFLVMGQEGDVFGKINVYLDDKFVKQITVDEYKLYELIKLDNPGKHTLRLEFLDSNLELYAFTFG